MNILDNTEQERLKNMDLSLPIETDGRTIKQISDELADRIFAESYQAMVGVYGQITNSESPTKPKPHNS